MPSLSKIIQNVETFLDHKFQNQEENLRLTEELKSTTSDLIQHPQLPVRRRLLALFNRFGVDEEIATKLVSSLITGIERERDKQFKISTEPIQTLTLPLLRENKETVTSRATSAVPEMRVFPEEKILDLIEEAAIPFAQLLGSNIAEALVIQDPGAVFKGRFLVQRILEGYQVDPIQIANLFTTLPSEKQSKLIKLLSDKVTQAQHRYQERQDDLLRKGNAHQWIYDRLRELYIPHQTAQTITPLIAQDYTVEELDKMGRKKFTKLVIDVIAKTSL